MLRERERFLLAPRTTFHSVVTAVDSVRRRLRVSQLALARLEHDQDERPHAERRSTRAHSPTARGQRARLACSSRVIHPSVRSHPHTALARLRSNSALLGPHPTARNTRPRRPPHAAPVDCAQRVYGSHPHKARGAEWRFCASGVGNKGRQVSRRQAQRAPREGRCRLGRRRQRQSGSQNSQASATLALRTYVPALLLSSSDPNTSSGRPRALGRLAWAWQGLLAPRTRC